MRAVDGDQQEQTGRGGRQAVTGSHRQWLCHPRATPCFAGFSRFRSKITLRCSMVCKPCKLSGWSISGGKAGFGGIRRHSGRHRGGEAALAGLNQSRRGGFRNIKSATGGRVAMTGSDRTATLPVLDIMTDFAPHGLIHPVSPSLRPAKGWQAGIRGNGPRPARPRNYP